MDNTYGLLDIQEMNLEILKEVDRICTEYKISYMLDAGTLLGAIRHNGFIPWDDDADIAMTRENWELFRRVLRKELPAHLHLLMPEDMKEGRVFYDFTPRIIYEKSRRHRESVEDIYYEGKLNHVWVDIFILDKIPQNRLLSGFIRLLQKKIYLLSMGHRYKLNYKDYGWGYRLLIFVFAHIGKLIPMRSLFAIQKKVSRFFDRFACKNLYYSNYQPDYLHIIVKKDWVKKMLRIQFEDTQLYVPDAYEEILTSVYGDYMKLPPKKDRKPTHASGEVIKTETEQ